jgi:ATP-dependent Clp protease ATP-binding subunit ClpB
LIQREVVDRIADQVVRGNLLEGDHVLIDVDAEGKYTCKVEKPLDLDLSQL